MKRMRGPARRSAVALHGREREVDAIVDLVRRRAAGCVTVTGMVGIGKSRVVAEARRRLSVDARTDARFVDGAPVDELAVSGREIVVVTAPALLGVTREHEVALGLLEVPRVGRGIVDDASLRRSPALALLADAARVEREALSRDELLALARVAAASDGHPVVLEHLAGWLWSLSPPELLEALERLEIALVPPELARRLGRARAALSPVDREILAAIAETTGELDARAVRAAVRARSRPFAARAIHALIASGWLVRCGSAAEPRVRVCAPFRGLARGRTGAGARRRLTRHHALRARPLLAAPVVDRALVARLVPVREELLASWFDAHAREDEDEVPLAVALAAVVTSGDPAAVELAGYVGATARRYPRARLLVAHGDALWLAGAPDEADAVYERARRRAAVERDVRVEAHAWIRRATLGPERAAMGEAHAHLARGARLARRSADGRLLALAAAIRGFLVRAEGNPRLALAAYEEQAEHGRRVGDLFHEASADANAAECHLALGERALGLARYERGLGRMKRVDPTWARALEGYMGLGAWESGALSEALTRLRRALGATLTPRFRAVFAAARAGVLAELGEGGRAKRALLRADAASASASKRAPHEALRAAWLLVASANTDAASRPEIERQIVTFLRERATVGSEDERPFLRALARMSARAGRLAPRLSDGALDGRPRLARVLEVLSNHAARGEAATPAALFRAAWPDSTGVPERTADARVRKAISLLRAFGLRGAIETTPEGYLLRAPRGDTPAPGGSSGALTAPRMES
jgi:tetratricopeptide (TPR) repeat protein